MLLFLNRPLVSINPINKVFTCVCVMFHHFGTKWATIIKRNNTHKIAFCKFFFYKFNYCITTPNNSQAKAREREKVRCKIRLRFPPVINSYYVCRIDSNYLAMKSTTTTTMMDPSFSLGHSICHFEIVIW